MKKRTIAGIVFGFLLAAPQAALAQAPLADPAGDLLPPPPAEEVTLVSVLGTGISISVAVDATGHLTSVELTDGAGGVPADAVATEVSPHEVKFVVGDTGTTIEVEAKGHKVETEVEARALADLTGTHTWTGELFGPGNGITEVSYTVADNGGMPTVELVSITGPGADTAVVTTETESDDDEYEAKLKIRLDDGLGNDARVDIKVQVEEEHGSMEAELKVTARSDFFGSEQAEGMVDDPAVNTPIDDDHDDDYDDDHDDDHDDDEDDDDDDDDDHDDDHHDDHDKDHSGHHHDD